MNEQRYDIVDMAENASAFGFSLGKGALKYIYKVSSLEALKDSFNAFDFERLLQRCEYFVYEHDKISENTKKEFYADLKHNTQNQNFIYEFVEKLRTTPFDLNARIVARLSSELVKNKSLNYYESIILTNIHMFNNIDWHKIYNHLKDIYSGSLQSHSISLKTQAKTFPVNDYKDHVIFNKLTLLGVILPSTVVQQPAQVMEPKNTFQFESPTYYITDCTDAFYKILGDVIEYDTKLQ
ncbi:hypothetical protein CP985_05550 [Malaciobacter mytili LMG 24559]|uniref:Uncharacterized protein n=1 Tax=Malaciobacter mytili LMG 24559 TaxID=1032238 RepID=A0AAX2AJ30_9BACT|nr:hypothetical protein [Malaciobacter mytili]AXH14386.1 hypothetical protein AMYT_0793 [Malaciobacter mytili LMG 24559]RXK16038.1 hypothetical protein CP985_05550 [Malaciobacter mytili LMG 24559]